MGFDQLGLQTQLLSAIAELGFETPTAVQSEAIPVALRDESDLIVVARTGTGKTAAFGLPLLQLITPSDIPQAIILSPTRELAHQIQAELRGLARHTPEIKVISVFGGTSIDRQITALKRGVSVVVATPGRLLDLIRRGALNPDLVRYLVLDEADEMLNMGFKDELDDILSRLPAERRTWLYSATMPRGVKQIARQFMSEAHEIRVAAGGDDDQPEGVIEHIAYDIPRGLKYEAILRLVDASDDLYAMVFCRTRLDTQALCDRLVADGLEVGALHGDLSQALRDQVMGRFKRRQIRLLIATDIAARGIDVDGLTHVFHYDLPDNAEAYTHRSGRTGRAGRDGISAIFVEPRDRRRAEFLARKMKLHIKPASLPTPQEVVARQLKGWLKSVLNASELGAPEALSAILSEPDEELTALLAATYELEPPALIERMSAFALSGLLNAHRLRDLALYSGKRGARDQDRGRRDSRDSRERRDSRDSRERRDSRDSRERRDSRDPRDSRERRESRDSRDSRERRDSRDSRERGDSRDLRDRRDSRDSRGSRDRAPERASAQKASHSHNAESAGRGRWTMVEVSIGSEGGLSEPALRDRLIQGGVSTRQLGRVEVLDGVSLFEVRDGSTDQALKSFKGFRLSGQKVRARRKS